MAKNNNIEELEDIIMNILEKVYNCAKGWIEDRKDARCKQKSQEKEIGNLSQEIKKLRDEVKELKKEIHGTLDTLNDLMLRTQTQGAQIASVLGEQKESCTELMYEFIDLQDKIFRTFYLECGEEILELFVDYFQATLNKDETDEIANSIKDRCVHNEKVDKTILSINEFIQKITKNADTILKYEGKPFKDLLIIPQQGTPFAPNEHKLVNKQSDLSGEENYQVKHALTIGLIYDHGKMEKPYVYVEKKQGVSKFGQMQYRKPNMENNQNTSDF